MWAGTEPGAVWRSADRGETFELVRGLWDHPHRTEWGEGFGGQAFHTILPHPDDPDSVTVAISTGGVYQTADGGRVLGAAQPGHPRRSSCPRASSTPSSDSACTRSRRHPSRPERLFLQNHGGVYRSDDHGATWESIAEGLPADFGFPVVVHPHEPDTVFVFPLNAGEGRYPTDGQARVWRSRDAGETWEALGDGLPDGFFVGVMRDAMCADDHASAGLYLGSAQRCGLGLERRGGVVATDRGQPARRAGGPGRGSSVRTRAPRG